MYTILPFIKRPFGLPPISTNQTKTLHREVPIALHRPLRALALCVQHARFDGLFIMWGCYEPSPSNTRVKGHDNIMAISRVERGRIKVQI